MMIRIIKCQHRKKKLRQFQIRKQLIKMINKHNLKKMLIKKQSLKYKRKLEIKLIKCQHLKKSLMKKHNLLQIR
jgi:hypothetical protein